MKEARKIDNQKQSVVCKDIEMTNVKGIITLENCWQSGRL